MLDLLRRLAPRMRAKVPETKAMDREPPGGYGRLKRSETGLRAGTRVGLHEGHRFQTIAVQIADERGIIRWTILRSRSGWPGARAARAKRSSVKRVHCLDRARAQRDMGGRNGVAEIRPDIDPEFRIAFAKADGS